MVGAACVIAGCGFVLGVCLVRSLALLSKPPQRRLTRREQRFGTYTTTKERHMRERGWIK